MPKIRFQHTYNYIISLENLLEAWKKLVKGKRLRKDIQEFERNLMENIISLHNELATKNYSHDGYEAFKINDPKPRDIHKATVRDRLLHRALYIILYPFFDRIFIADSYLIIKNFLQEELKLELHPNKVSIKTIYSGVDFFSVGLIFLTIGY